MTLLLKIVGMITNFECSMEERVEHISLIRTLKPLYYTSPGVNGSTLGCNNREDQVRFLGGGDLWGCCDILEARCMGVYTGGGSKPPSSNYFC